ncbi:MAG: hypothetical protein ACK5X3_17800 [Pseudomonadota bacterium]
MPFNPLAFTALCFANAPDKKRVVVGSVSTWGTFDDREELALDENGQPVTVRTRQVKVTAGSLSGLVDGATVTVDGVAYVMTGRPMPQENGDMWMLRLRRSES